MMDIAAILNTITAGLLLGAGKLLMDVKSQLAVHAEKHDRHDARLEKLEDRPECPHI